MSEAHRKAASRNYGKYLHTPHWFRMRVAVLTRDKNRCQKCGATDELQVHHGTYERLGRERLSDLVTWCKDCHREHHRLAVESEGRSQSVVMDPAEARRARLDDERQERERAKQERSMPMEEVLREGGGRFLA